MPIYIRAVFVSLPLDLKAKVTASKAEARFILKEADDNIDKHFVFVILTQRRTDKYFNSNIIITLITNPYTGFL